MPSAGPHLQLVSATFGSGLSARVRGSQNKARYGYQGKAKEQSHRQASRSKPAHYTPSTLVSRSKAHCSRRFSSDLNYGRENAIETYYTLHAWRGAYPSFGFQYVKNPGYNRDHGPVLVPSLRLHLEF